MNPPPAEGLASRLFLGPALRTQPDRRLVTLVRDGYDAAFEEIVRRYGKPLARYAAGIVGGRSEDVTQDAFSKALLALRRDSEAEIDLKPWLYRIVRNTALNDLRDRPPDTEELIEALGSGSRSAAEEAERREEMSELLRRLRALPEPQRAAIVMRELEGLSHDEIAAALGLSGGAARQTIYRARQALRDGFGLMIPMPILRLLIEPGTEAGAAAAGAGAGAAAAAGAGAGAGTALKVGVVSAVLAGSVGTGLAIKEDRSPDRDPGTAAAATVPTAPRTQAEGGATGPAAGRQPTAGLASGSDAGGGRGGSPNSVQGSVEKGSGTAGGPGHDGGGPDRGQGGPGHPEGADGGPHGPRAPRGPRGEPAGHEGGPSGPPRGPRNHFPTGGEGGGGPGAGGGGGPLPGGDGGGRGPRPESTPVGEPVGGESGGPGEESQPQEERAEGGSRGPGPGARGTGGEDGA